MRFLWWLPVSPIVGFVVAGRFLAEPWPLWKVAPLALALAIPFAIGAYFGFKAIRLGDRRGWFGLIAHFALMVTALAMPISEALA